MRWSKRRSNPMNHVYNRKLTDTEGFIPVRRRQLPTDDRVIDSQKEQVQAQGSDNTSENPFQALIAVLNAASSSISDKVEEGQEGAGMLMQLYETGIMEY